jgi:hypothetical protein
VYVKRSIFWLLPANTSAWFHWSPWFPDILQSVAQLEPSAELSRTTDPMPDMEALYMWYWNETPLRTSPAGKVFSSSKFVLPLDEASA